MSDVTRRELLAGAGIAAGSLAFGFPGRELFALQENGVLPAPNRPALGAAPRPCTAIILGHGGRGGLYGYYAGQMPDTLKIVGVAEPLEYRRTACVNNHKIEAANTFTTWEHVFDRPKFADAVIVTTQDRMHYEPTMRALEMGYDVLLEKPIAPSWKECNDILKLAQAKGRIVGVCHVLRYSPFNVQIKAVIESGMIGDVVSVQHIEPIWHLHFSHSYVRGPWRREDLATPSLLAKSCHDLDLINWWMDEPVKAVSSFGGLRTFHKRNAPAGAPRFCMDGCPHRESCIYHAEDVYVNKKRWGTHHIETPDRSEESIRSKLRRGQYGQCVYQADNTVNDHQVVNMLYRSGATAAFSMEAMTSYGGRRTRIMGTKGDIVGDERYLDVATFNDEKRIRWDVEATGQDLSGHGGGDQRMTADWAQAVVRNDPSFLVTKLEDAMESHRVGYAAVTSSKEGGRLVTL